MHLSLGSLLCLGAALAAQQPVDFQKEVWPILQEKCVDCHGDDTVKARLRLDAKATALAGGKSGRAIVPGQSAKSLLYQRVTSTVEKERMPLDEAPLDAAEVLALQRWIDAGAVWPDGIGAAVTEVQKHWSFVPPRRPPVPAVAGVTNPIDAFVRARLAKEGITPAAQADQRTLLRRVTLDLTGLLPTDAETSRFLGDAADSAYERLVDRLLASPHYGEHAARAWLDVARYADTDGYAIDGPRAMWRWRDWVIAAFNSDLPFDRFTTLQIAGDLLPDATLEQRLATGFHRNTMRNEEGGVDPEEFRVEAVKDRVNTTATAWLGLTLGCAQCHDHKYDPLTQRDYYQMFAFWNDADEHDELVDATKPKDRDSKALVLRQRKEARKTQIQIKGDFLRLGDEVAPGTPQTLPALTTDHRPTRLDLARWLVCAENPLTARVQVNRLWQRLFGEGLVATENDFGSQGSKPSHPELLDWLATEFVRLGWSQKALLRLVVTSSTYRQASTWRKDLADQDPANRLLARQARLRLSAESIRDAALLASGLLSSKIGGRSVHPPIPDGVTAQGQVERPWKTSTGPDRHRRGLYTAFWRSTPHPALVVFDAPTAVECCTKRNVSNTPLQALTLLHDASFFECAQALAERLEAAQGDTTARIALGFSLCLQRPPTARELAICTELARSGKLLAVARALLNLDAFVTRE